MSGRTLKSRALPLLENDLNEKAFIESSEVITSIDMPSCVVLCFFNEVVTDISTRFDTKVLKILDTAHGPHPLYEIEFKGKRLAVLLAGVGAPLATGLFEEVIALGGRTFVAVGGAGALVPDLVLGHAIIINSALRDDGTSLHYFEPSRTVDASLEGVLALQGTLTGAGVSYVTGRTWTTDAMFGETRSRVLRRVEEHCVSVELEASALISVARYRNVNFGQLL